MSFPLPPLAVLTDSYKTTHFQLYPPCEKMVAYGEFRQSFEKDPEDHRIVFYGMRHIVENYVARKWTREDVERSAKFYETHNAGGTPFPFPKELFLKFVEENNGYFPVLIESLPEGTVVYPHIPVYQITSAGEYAPLCTFLETLLTMVWYPTTVATLSRRAKTLIENAFETSVDKENYWLLDSRLHDFGFRGCTSVEQSIIGGTAHLLNFTGSDTLSAAYHVQFHLNHGKPIAQSIPATEHSVMTSWPTEKDAMLNLMEHFGTGLYACVMDSYDYAQALTRLLPVVAAKKLEKGGFLVLRPDSGDPIETVLMALRAGEKVFGCKKNSKGFKVIQGCGVIQGDGVTYETIQKILQSALAEGYSAQNVAFGMGGGLLQKVNRDTMSFATKLSHIEFKDGSKRDIMKTPKTDTGKFSLPGELSVRVNDKQIPVVVLKTATSLQSPDCIFQPVYDHGKVCEWQDFETIRNRVQEQWKRLPPKTDVLSAEIKQKVDAVKKEQAARASEMLASV